MLNKTVLIVDDEPNILLSIHFLMEQAGLKVQQAERATIALDLAQQSAPDIAILDVMMPEMDGFELAKRLRNLPGLENIQIIFLTARGSVEDRKEGYRSGGEIYLTKPFENEELVTTVLELLTYG